MKSRKYLISLVLAAVLSAPGCSGRLYQEDIPRGFKLNPEKWAGLQGGERPKTITGIQDFLYREILFVPEKKENWSSPKKTLERGYGDCDDMAIAGSYLAEPLGYEPKVLFLIDPERGAHAATLLEEKNPGGIKYGAIQHAEVFYPVYDSIEGMVHDINRSYDIIDDSIAEKLGVQKMNYTHFLVLDLNSLNKNWRTTDENLAEREGKLILNLVPVEPSGKTKYNGIRGYKAGPSLVFEFPGE